MPRIRIQNKVAHFERHSSIYIGTEVLKCIKTLDKLDLSVAQVKIFCNVKYFKLKLIQWCFQMGTKLFFSDCKKLIQ